MILRPSCDWELWLVTFVLARLDERGTPSMGRPRCHLKRELSAVPSGHMFVLAPRRLASESKFPGRLVRGSQE
jgi:hypothetical protein